MATRLRFGPVHPGGVARAHHGFAVDENGGAFEYVVADFHVGLADEALAHSGFVALHGVDETDFVAIRFLLPKVDVFRHAFAFAQLVHNGIGRGGVGFGRCKTDIGRNAYQHEVVVFG